MPANNFSVSEKPSSSVLLKDSLAERNCSVPGATSAASEEVGRSTKGAPITKGNAYLEFLTAFTIAESENFAFFNFLISTSCSLILFTTSFSKSN